jgi:hypothetical protein
VFSKLDALAVFSGPLLLAPRSVEAAAYDGITPKDPRPSLGKMIAALKFKPEKWSIEFLG